MRKSMNDVTLKGITSVGVLERRYGDLSPHGVPPIVVRSSGSAEKMNVASTDDFDAVVAEGYSYHELDADKNRQILAEL